MARPVGFAAQACGMVVVVFLLGGFLEAMPGSAFAGFSSPRQVNPDAASDSEADGGGTIIGSAGDEAPSVATDGSGVAVVAWLKSNVTPGPEIRCMRSTDGGKKWSGLTYITTGTNSLQNPHVATDGAGTWVIAWGNAGTAPASYTRSTDNGLTWSTPTSLSSFGVDTVQIVTSIATDRNGIWLIGVQVAPFHVTDSYNSDAYAFRSDNNGQTWSSLQPLNTYTNEDVQSDFGPYIASNGAGKWVAAWGSATVVVIPVPVGVSLPAEMDHFTRVTTSGDNGQTWSRPVTVDVGEPRILADLNPIALECNQQGTWLLAHSKSYDTSGTVEADLVFNVSTDNGTTWTATQTVYPDPTHEFSDILPSVSHDENGNWLLAWTQYSNAEQNPETDLVYSVAGPAGLDWATPKRLNRNARKDAGQDMSVALAHVGRKRHVAVWSSNNMKKSHNVADYDIWCARGSVKP